MRNWVLTNGRCLWWCCISLHHGQQGGRKSSRHYPVWAVSPSLPWCNGLPASLCKAWGKKLTSPPLSCYITVFGHSDTEQTKIHNCFLKDSKCIREDYLRKVHFSQCLGKSVLNRKHTDQGEWDWAHTLLPSPKRITLRSSWLGKLLWRCGVKTSNWGCAVSLCVLGLW